MRELIVGVIGSRYPIPRYQSEPAIALLEQLRPTAVHHGGCTGADELLAIAASKLDSSPTIVCHPASDVPDWFRSKVAPADFVQPAQPALKRNRAIAKAVHVLIACPSDSDPSGKSGTWSTVRAAKRFLGARQAGLTGGPICLIVVYLPVFGGKVLRVGSLPPELRAP